MDNGSKLDEGIETIVLLFKKAGVETFASCEGGEGHPYPEPIIRFHGERGEGFRVFALAMENGLPVRELRRVWQIVDGEPSGPFWELTFAR